MSVFIYSIMRSHASGRTLMFHTSNGVILHNHECIFMHSVNGVHTSESVFQIVKRVSSRIRMNVFMHSTEYFQALNEKFLRSSEYSYIFDRMSFMHSIAYFNVSN